MDLLHTLQIDRLAHFAQSHVREIAFAMATSFVVVISRPLDSFINRVVGKWNFFLRTLAWIIVFTVGYSVLANWSERVLRGFLGDQKPYALMVLVSVGFLGFGIWAGESRNHK